MYKQISSSMEVTDNVKCIVMFKGDLGAFLVAQSVKNLPAVQETQVSSLGQEDPLEKGMTTHSSILAWEIQWTEEPGGAPVHGVTKSN